MQMRDFVYVKDAASVVSFFVESATGNKPAPSGIYNIGTGKARSFKDLATAVMTGMAREPHITFIDMPLDLQGKYQYFTEATMSKLTGIGYNQPFHSLEEGVHDYVQNYLMQEDKYC